MTLNFSSIKFMRFVSFELFIFLVVLSIGCRLDFGDRFNSYPKRIMGQGDGYVNMRSLLGFERWRNSTTQRIHGVYQQEFPGIDHVNIVDNKNAINYILNELKDDRKEFQRHPFKNPFNIRIPIFQQIVAIIHASFCI